MSVAFAICPRCSKVLQVEVIDWPGVPAEMARHLSEHLEKEEASSSKSGAPLSGASALESDRRLPHSLPSHRPSPDRPHGRSH
ncbi:MAG: hypothetical protein KGJ23_14300 [Euryarchaeota archaeon]|nr:hypothetical protein [Euryarchaeota archaeon]MDE1837771.1 hypothetical protein [Euryarchaeota archaeon]MDE1880190.1 hypothetical protein [Euryarchaeota archaeon]MDE2045407.1 hypothetical protein [Thermoplasmata archaeon]